MALTNSAALWHERNAAQLLDLGRLVQIATGIYEFRTTGPADAVLQSDGVGGYDVIAGGSSDGRVAVIGSTGAIY